MDTKQIKAELTSVCKAAIATYLDSTSGASAFGPRAEVTEPKPNALLISVKPHGALRFFEVIVKESY